MKRGRLLLFSLLVLVGAISLSSCSKDKFRMFDDMDCITTEELVKIELPLTEIPGKGGIIKLIPSVYTEVTYWQKNAVIDVKKVPIKDYTVSIVEAPEGTTVERGLEGIVLNVPSNNTSIDVPIVIQINAGGVSQQFAFIQKRNKYNVDVELS